MHVRLASCPRARVLAWKRASHVVAVASDTQPMPSLIDVQPPEIYDDIDIEQRKIEDSEFCGVLGANQSPSRSTWNDMKLAVSLVI
jgi:hypothetical protein